MPAWSLEAAKRFCGHVFGLKPVMDHGWMVPLADPHQPRSQISLMTHDDTAAVVPDVSIQVDDVDAAYAAALQAGTEIIHPLTHQPWKYDASSPATRAQTSCMSWEKRHTSLSEPHVRHGLPVATVLMPQLCQDKTADA